MRARKKLNAAYLNGSLLMAIAVGLVAESWGVFGISLLILLTINVLSGDIRPPRAKL